MRHTKIFVCLIFFVIINLYYLNHGDAFADTRYLNHLLSLSESKQLYNDRYWQILLHYKNSLFGIKSLIDDPGFFLSTEGKTNPQSELRETIRSFFNENIQNSEHPRCRFIARYTWLKEMLDIDESRLPRADCNEYREIADRIIPKMSAIVFPNVFMNRPASMFGHTFIRLDNNYQSKLLSHAVNYSAFTGGSGGFLYALKGVFGYYTGYFSVLPYYDKVNEYNDMEQRDMWEYNLNLTEKELQRMLMHIWELKDIYSYYYFFDENCSYNILFLFEAARPSINLTDKFGFWTIPIDTVRAVKASGMVESVNYRPSQATIINHILSRLDKTNIAYAKKIIEGKDVPEKIITGNASHEEKIMVIDLAAEVLQYKYAKKKLSKEEYLKRFLGVLNVRSQLGNAEGNTYIIPQPPEPEKVHGSSKLGLGIGIKDDRFFQEIRIRPAYHDLLDPDEVYLEGSQIIFADIRVRYYIADKIFSFDGIDLIDITSISPRKEFFKPLSWKIRTGVSQRLQRDGNEHTTYFVNGGGGLAFKNRFLGIYYIIAEADGNIGRYFEDGYSAGLGISAGVLKRINDFWKVNISLGEMHYFLGDRHSAYKGTIGQNLKISRNNSFRFEYTRSKTFGIYGSEAKLSWNIYF